MNSQSLSVHMLEIYPCFVKKEIEAQDGMTFLKSFSQLMTAGNLILSIGYCVSGLSSQKTCGNVMAWTEGATTRAQGCC